MTPAPRQAPARPQARPPRAGYPGPWRILGALDPGAPLPLTAAPKPSGAAYGLAGLLTLTGVTHFALPRFYDAIVPHVLPGSPRAWTLVSGVAELACAATVAVPRTRRLGATVAALLFVAVFPANVQMAVDWRSRSVLDQAIAYGRLPLQIPLVLWAVSVRRATPAPRRRARTSAGRNAP